jgi:hypothetical protein
MKKNSNSGIVGAALIGLGFGLTAIGIAMVIPAGVGWASELLDTAVKRGREGAGTAAEVLGDMAGKATHHFGAATKSAKAATSKAAGVVEGAARQVREFTA